MRWSGCCLIGLVLACGKSVREADEDAEGARQGAGAGGSAGSPAGTGGRGGGSPAGGTASEPSTNGGLSNGGLSNGGFSNGGFSNGGLSNGGGSPSAGASGSTAGGGAAFGGAGGVGGASGAGGSIAAGRAGAAGASGAPPLECDGSYTACGCGCCDQEMSNDLCYYLERGESLAAIRARDEMAAASPSCATTGCTLGDRYFCCMTPAEAGVAAYESVGYSSDARYIGIQRTSDTGRCTSLWIATSPSGVTHPLELPASPSRWFFHETWDGECEDGAPDSRRAALGVLGWVRFEDLCEFDIDATLFFLEEDGSVDAVRFQADSVPFPSPPADCR